MSVDIKKLHANIKLAHDENVPKGIELAWGDVDGNQVSWSDLLEVVGSLNEKQVKKSTKKVVEKESEVEEKDEGSQGSDS